MSNILPMRRKQELNSHTSHKSARGNHDADQGSDIAVAETTDRKEKEVKPADEGAEVDPIGTRRKDDFTTAEPSRSISSGFSFDYLKREAKITGRFGEMVDKDIISFGGLIVQLNNFKAQK